MLRCVEGLQRYEIAESLHISESTVKGHLETIRVKFGKKTHYRICYEIGSDNCE